jgi:glycine/D-amino acid oxidase-like deaminating enzyme
VRSRFPAWNADRYAHGTYNPLGGYVESGKVVAHLAGEARRLGVDLREGISFGRLLEGLSPAGMISTTGERFEADKVVLALGAWTPHTLPWLGQVFRSTGHPVFHLAPRHPAAYQPERFPVFCAEIQSTGYYGFPAHPETGVVKIARHGAGRLMHPASPERSVTAGEVQALRAFLAATFPGLADAPISSTRICLYCDTWDGHFWIAHDPDRPGVVLATGDSGHGFKFAPLLGALIADVVEGRTDPRHRRFRWRPGVHPARSEEAARSAAT